MRPVCLRARCASVVLAAWRIDRLQDLVAKIQAEGGQAMASPVDVTNGADIENMIKSVIENYERIDVLFNNAGFGRLDWLENLDPLRDIRNDKMKINVGVIKSMTPTFAIHQKSYGKSVLPIK